MGGGFLWGAFAHAFLCLTVVFTQQPNPVQYPFDHKCGWGIGKLCRGGSVALF